MVQLNVKECIMPDDKNNYDLGQVKAVLERCGVVVTEQPKGHFTTKNIEQDLARLLNEEGAAKAKGEFRKKEFLIQSNTDILLFFFFFFPLNS